ncbi:hypothetical protein KCP69_20955 [Salmonella enterica subsp. enterica]|nr:hypothetical protein KCP69_20955 [Salmonella enterica subsp. enterica]
MIAQNLTGSILTTPRLYRLVVAFSVAGDAAFQRAVVGWLLAAMLLARRPATPAHGARRARRNAAWRRLRADVRPCGASGRVSTGTVCGWRAVLVTPSEDFSATARANGQPTGGSVSAAWGGNLLTTPLLAIARQCLPPDAYPFRHDAVPWCLVRRASPFARHH